MNRILSMLASLLLLINVFSANVIAEVQVAPRYYNAAELQQWVEGLSPLTMDASEFTRHMREVFPEFNYHPDEPLSFDRAEMFLGQLDNDSEEEVVVQVIHLGKFGSGAVRDEFFWVAIFDAEPGGYRLVGLMHEQVAHCSYDERRLGLYLQFAKASAGPDAHLTIHKQRSDSCGTIVSYGFVLDHLRVEFGSLKRVGFEVREGVGYDRIQPGNLVDWH